MSIHSFMRAARMHWNLTLQCNYLRPDTCLPLIATQQRVSTKLHLGVVQKVVHRLMVVVSAVAQMHLHQRLAKEEVKTWVGGDWKGNYFCGLCFLVWEDPTTTVKILALDRCYMWSLRKHNNHDTWTVGLDGVHVSTASVQTTHQVLVRGNQTYHLEVKLMLPA